MKSSASRCWTTWSSSCCMASTCLWAGCASNSSSPPVQRHRVIRRRQLRPHLRPPATAALERKHPVEALQQLRPQISRRVSTLRRGAACIQCLWPRWITPRRQLPPSLRRHLRPAQHQPLPSLCQHTVQHALIQV